MLNRPATATRPVLTAAEAARFTPDAYLRWSGPYDAPVADPWHPAPVQIRRPDLVVGAPGFATVQEAVDAAAGPVARPGGSSRSAPARTPAPCSCRPARRR